MIHRLDRLIAAFVAVLILVPIAAAAQSPQPPQEPSIIFVTPDGKLALGEPPNDKPLGSTEAPRPLYWPDKALKDVDRCYTFVAADVSQLRPSVRASVRPTIAGTDIVKAGERVSLCRSQLLKYAIDQVVTIAVLRHLDGSGQDDEKIGAVRFRTAAPLTLKTLTDPTVTIELDRTGIADWRFLNARRLYQLIYPPDVKKDDRKSRPRRLRFVNRLSDREFTVTFKRVPATSQLDFLSNGFHVTCTGETCSASLTIPRRDSKEVDVWILVDAYRPDPSKSVQPVQFTVAFFGDQSKVANPTGAFSLAPAEYLKEADGGTEWSASVSASATRGPDTKGLQPPCVPGTTDCPKDAAITAEHPYTGVDWSSADGKVLLDLTQKLGERARADVELQVKKGALGDATSASQVQLATYRLNIFVRNGATFSGGKYLFAAPGHGIAVNEKGEGLEAAFRWFDAAYVFNKEVPKGTALRSLNGVPPTEPGHPPGSEGAIDGNAWTGVLQVKNIRALHRVVLGGIAVYGRTHPKAIKNRYWTFGVDGSVALPGHFDADVAWYATNHRADSAPAGSTDPLEKKGRVWLANLVWSKPHPESTDGTVGSKGSAFTVSGTVGRGSANYVGPSGSFEPDLIFLSTLAGAFPGDAKTNRVVSGLDNKLYAALSIDSPRVSPLVWLAAVIKTPLSDVASKGTTVTWHHYRFNQPVFDRRDAGNEIDLQMRIEAPADINYTASLGWFWRGTALSSVLTKQRYFLAQISLSVKL